MDYEALKEQWSEVEERDGVRLSWNVFPSSRMVSEGLLTGSWGALLKQE
jgi:protein transport protein SEC23